MKRSSVQVLRKLVGLVSPMLPYMLLAITLGILGFCSATAIPLLGGYGIVRVLCGAGQSLLPLFLAALLCALLRGALRYGEQLCNHYIAFKLLALIRNRVFAALRRLAPAKLDGREKGNLISILTADIELLEIFYAHTISPIFIAIVMTIIMVVYIGHFHLLLGAIALAAYLVIGVLLPLVTAKRSRQEGQEIRDGLGGLQSYVLESLYGMDETMQYAQGQVRRRGMRTRGEEMTRANGRLKAKAGANSAAANTAISLFSLLMLLAVIYLKSHGLIGFDAALYAVIAFMSSFGPTAALANLGAGLQQTIASGNRVLDILEEEPLVEGVSGKPSCSFDGAAAEHVSFSYDDALILDGVSVEIPKGSIVGISGKSGSGKSTLLKLFMRFWDADSGRIAISQCDIKDINTDELRAMEGFMTQETSLFHDSIEANIKIGKLDATHEEVVEAAKKASVHDFISALPKGYDTNVGELGERLSGGERQRLGLARAFLHDAPLLLLDEPTSNLDSLNEAVILRALEQARGARTVVLVSHRLSTLRMAEKSYSVEHGRIS